MALLEVRGAAHVDQQGIAVVDQRSDLGRAEAADAGQAPGDLVVCLGAGSITYWAQALPAELQAIYGARE